MLFAGTAFLIIRAISGGHAWFPHVVRAVYRSGQKHPSPHRQIILSVNERNALLNPPIPFARENRV